MSKLSLYLQQVMYDTMVAKGMPEVIAAAIACQADHLGQRTIMHEGSDLFEHIVYFLDWDDAKEGSDCWAAISDSIK
jgi:hypothetical protein